ncbi:H+/Cl-antiporter ClcA [Propionibacterium cyclohexanicum]|uniref:H+/Cl-antiporter ClcA n=2 Tax=Propionibacterium cyclohexanicum TaxID=64702 RepID=A0A1H9TEP9_9ACTN|nr:H+/Cl-antiporter ClcA [Propionibacterium cyclohexanicum]
MLVATMVAAGIASGMLGVAVSQISRGIEAAAFGFEFSHSASGVAAAPWWRRLAAALVAGGICGILWTRLRPRPRGFLPTVRQVAARGVQGRRWLPVGGTIADGLGQLLIVGSGMSLGREAAPRRFAALLGQGLADRCGLDVETRRVMIASAGGAGLAAVYNVPLAGLVYALEFVIRPDLRTRAGWSKVVVSTVVALLSTVTAWLFNRNTPMYRLPPDELDVRGYGWAVAMGIVALAAAVPLRRALRWARSHTALTAHLWWSMPLGTLTVAGLALWEPRIAGNGQVLVQATLVGGLPAATLAMLCLAKVFATLLSFRCGATGGLLTPSLAVGATLGAALAKFTGATGSQVCTAALVGAACVLSVTEAHPVFAATFVMGLVQAPPQLCLAIGLGVAITWCARLLSPAGRSRTGSSRDSPDSSSG